jgi:hypothetical protein
MIDKRIQEIELITIDNKLFYLTQITLYCLRILRGNTKLYQETV